MSKNATFFLLASFVLLSGCLRQKENDISREVPVVAPAAEPPSEADLAAAAQGASQDRPNVLLVLFDDLNDWVGHLDGYPGVQTPHLDRLAKRGLSFTNAHANAPACNPSRTALLSGLRPTTSGVYFNGQPYLSALPGSYTLVEYFALHGYRTLGAGKVFHTYGSGKLVWDEYYDKMPDPEPEAENRDSVFQEKHFNWGPVDVNNNRMADTRIAKAAAKWLVKPSEKPFFLAVGFHRPHLPWHVPPRFFEDYPRAKITIPKGYKAGDLADVPRMGRRLARTDEHGKIRKADAWEDALQGYLASVTFADAALSVLVKALERGPHKDNTIIIVTSDHGFHLGEKNHWGKYSLWREATRIPLVIIAPGMKAKNKTTVRPATLIDIYPTLIDLCHLTPAQNLDGVSLAPLLDNPSQRWPHPALTTHRSGNNSVRTENWTLIRYHDGTQELYSSAQDPYEWNNLAGDPEMERRIQMLARHIPKAEAPNAPFSFNPYDLKATTRNLLRFFPADKLQAEIDRQQKRREKLEAEQPEPDS